MTEETSGASRRAVLRNSAIGVGALVGAMTLANAEEVSADAAGTTTHTYYLVLGGINDSTHRIKLNSLSFGGDNANGALNADVVSLSMPTGQFSPLILQAFVNKTSTIKATIKGYQPSATGQLQNFVTITCNGSEIVHYHLGVSSSGTPTDSVQLRYASIDLNWVLTSTHYTWQLPA